MNYFIAILCSVFLTAFSLNEKLCINCKYLTKPFFEENKFGKCTLFPKIKNPENCLVTGVVIEKAVNDFYYCSTARGFNDMCGRDGKRFVKKNKKKCFMKEDEEDGDKK